MRNISFGLTKEQIRNRTKTVTRRLGWKNVKVGDRLQGVEKAMGLKPGEKIVKLAVVEVVDVRREVLAKMWNCVYGEREAEREGFPETDGEAFVEMFCKAMKCTPMSEVTRIEFKYVD